MRSFRCTMIIFKEYSQLSILSTVLYIFLTLKFAVIHFANAHFFSVFQNTSSRETNLSKQLYFQSSIDYIDMTAATWRS